MPDTARLIRRDFLRVAGAGLLAGGMLNNRAAGEPGSAQSGSKAAVDLDPLDCRWTFGNHEPIAMYRRIGGPSTGGIEGSALWLEDWHQWFDSEDCPRLMEELGLNMLHCRFYKGMGWQHESKDFPNVKRFVANCHKHGVRVLAYVQFSTLYYEIMQAEISDLADWAAVDENGRKRTYHGSSYFRWLPCINAPGFEPYLARMVRIALTEGGFDGIMFDNCFAPACYCPRCVGLFRDYLAREPDPERLFGIPTVEHVLPPPPARYGELRDPIAQRWLTFRCGRLTALFRRLYEVGKSCKPSAIMSGNIAAIRRADMAGSTALIPTDLRDCFDLFVSQSGNEPGLSDGSIINRVREMKLAGALDTHILALSDSDAGISPDAEAKYVLNLMENAAFGGIPIDRTVMRADPDMVSRELVEFRRPLLRKFNEAVDAGREGLKLPSYAPVRLLYSRESILFSERAHRALLVAEEILLRNHVPYGLLPTEAATELEIPSGCEVLLVCDQTCLSDAELSALLRFAQRGGPLIVTGRSGEYDQWYRQRRANPLAALAGCKNAIRRETVDTAPVRGAGWTIRVEAPGDGGRRLLGDLAKVWSPAIRIEAPETVFAEVKRADGQVTVHLLNYAPEPVPQGVRVEMGVDVFGPIDGTFSAPMEDRQPQPLAIREQAGGPWQIDVPGFSDYAVLALSQRRS
ncbi:MAG: hypothetical protein RBS80_15445 [Thermoguttaceae bacterium]|jgi:hypothetical protein|nr:hypothetical protein [Thermoguttaceae bacterium]